MNVKIELAVIVLAIDMWANVSGTEPNLLDAWAAQLPGNYPASDMREHEVSTHINNVRHEGEECLSPPTPRPVNPGVPKPRKNDNPDQMGLGF